MSATAAAVDPILLETRGFTLTDVMEVVLGHADRVTTVLSRAWPDRPSSGEREPRVEPILSDAELAAVRDLVTAAPAELASSCSHPERAALALVWLTRPAYEVKVARDAAGPVLGVTLVIDRGAHPVGVPAALSLATLAAATQLLADEAARAPLARSGLQALTERRTVRLLEGRTAGPVTTEIVDQAAAVDAGTQTSDGSGDRVLRPLVMRGSRHVTTTVSGLGTGELSRALGWADNRLASQTALAGQVRPSEDDALTKVVVYGGPAVLAFQEVTDTLRLHVEELAEILADAQGDQTLFVCFLAELCQPHREETVLVLDVLDAWSVWQARGFLTLPGIREPYRIQAKDLGDDLAWRRAAMWEPIEQILFDASAPASVDWPAARLNSDAERDDADSAALSARVDGTALLVRRNPDVLVWVHLEDADRLGLSRDGLFGLADGLQATLGRQPAIDSHLQLANGTPLTLVLRLLTERTPEGHDGIRFGVSMDPNRGVLELAVGSDVLDLFQGDGREGHSLLGAILHEAVSRLRTARGEGPGTTATGFGAAWDSCSPVMTLSVVESSAPDKPQTGTLPHGPYLRFRALRAVAAALRERGVATGTFTGEQALHVCVEYLLPALEEILRARIQACRPELLTDALRWLNAAHATRYAEQATLARSLAGPFADNWIDHALQAQEGAATTRPLEVLFEYILADPPDGQRSVDVLEIADLAALADLLLTVATLVSGAGRNLHDVTIHISEGGVFTFNDDIDPVGIDVADIGFDHHAYSRAHREQQVALARTTPPGEPPAHRRLPVDEGRRSPLPFSSLRDVADAELLQADELLRDSVGASLDAVFAVLNVARDWPVGREEITLVEPSVMAAEAADWSGLPITEVDAALQTLQLSGEDLASLNGQMMADLETRAHRLALRPLPMVDGQLLVAPWLVHAAQGVYVNYLGDSRLPYPRRIMPSHLEHLMQQRRQPQNDQLEDDVQAVVSELGLPHRFRFREGDAAAAGIPDLPGEIDLLIADSGHDRLWVCEVKDPQTAYSPSAIYRHITGFIKPNGHVDKLLNKTRAISHHAASAAIACGETEPRSWRVVPLMITRWTEPAAFVANPRVAFTEVDRLAAVLRAQDDPAPGPRGHTHGSDGSGNNREHETRLGT